MRSLPCECVVVISNRRRPSHLSPAQPRKFTVTALATLPISPPTSADRDLQNRVSLFIQQRQLSRGAQQLTVLASRGVVTLSGIVPTFHQRQLLHSLTRHVAGVVQVRDELDVQTLDDDDADLGRDDSRQTRIRVVC
jgi:hypothetical protein